MGLRSLLIVLVVLGAREGLGSIAAAALILFVVLFNLLLKFLLKDIKNLPIIIVLTAILVGLVSMVIHKQFPYWHEEYKVFIYSLPLISVVMLEYAQKKGKDFLKEVYIFLQGLISIGILKELLSYGTIFDFKIIKNYEGILYFDTNSGTILLIVFALIVYNKVGDSNDKNH